MHTICRGRMVRTASLGLALSFLTGCQTWIAGMTLPSGRYLEHVPQYFPQEPDFPLQKELAAQDEINSLTAPGSVPAGGNAVNPVPAAPAPMPPQR